MQNERWNRLEQIFAEAAALPTAARAAFLERACGADASLRNEIESLLRSHDAVGVLDAAPPSSNTSAPLPSLPAHTTLGPWRIEHLIGRGGMGEVYAATRADGAFEQRVALKLLRHEAVGQLERFHAERRILARLEHPGIARLLDGGIAPDGRPYTVMEHVEGQSLTEYCRARNANLHERLALFAQVCDAVAFAHRNLVIHRDLKPANILVNTQGEVKLLDFGIAKLLDAAAAPRDTDITVAPFTPDYAAPEQLSGEPVTTATDVYALGVLLFELLTGDRPLQLRGVPSMHALTLLLERSPPPPSRIAQGKSDAPVPARLLRGDIDAIVAKCLRKEAAHRYETVNGLKRDVERHLRNQPVSAREGARLYVFGRLVRRYRWAMAATFVLILTLAVGLAGTAWQARRAEREATRATATKDFVLSVFVEQDPFKRDQTQALTSKQLLDRAVQRIDTELAQQSQERAELLAEFGEIQLNIGDSKSARAVLERALSETRALHGGDSVESAAIMQHLAEALSDQGEVGAAEAMLRDALAILDAHGASGSLTAARVMATLAYQLNQKKPGSAEEQTLIAEALRIHESVLGPDHVETSKLLARQAHMLMVARDNVRAEALALEALARIERAQGPLAPWLHRPLVTLGRVAEEAERWPEAQRYYARAAEVLRKPTNGISVQLSTALILLSGTYRQQGDLTTAMSVLDEAEKSTPSGERAMLTNIYSERGQLSADLHDDEAAERWLHKAYEARRELLGERHRVTLATAGIWGGTLAKLNRLVEAEAVQRKALADMQAALGAGSPYLGNVKKGLAETLRRQGRVEEAKALLAETEKH